MAQAYTYTQTHTTAHIQTHTCTHKSNSDEESQQLMDNSEDEAQRRKSQTFHPSATKRQSYGGTPSASTLPPYVKYTRRSCDLPSKSTLTTVPEISIETSNPQKSAAQSKGGLGQRMDGNKHVSMCTSCSWT